MSLGTKIRDNQCFGVGFRPIVLWIHPLVVNVRIRGHDLVVIERIVEQHHDAQFGMVDGDTMHVF